MIDKKIKGIGLVRMNLFVAILCQQNFIFENKNNIISINLNESNSYCLTH